MAICNLRRIPPPSPPPPPPSTTASAEITDNLRRLKSVSVSSGVGEGDGVGPAPSASSGEGVRRRSWAVCAASWSRTLLSGAAITASRLERPSGRRRGRRSAPRGQGADAGTCLRSAAWPLRSPGAVRSHLGSPEVTWSRLRLPEDSGVSGDSRDHLGVSFSEAEVSRAKSIADEDQSAGLPRCDWRTPADSADRTEGGTGQRDGARRRRCRVREDRLLFREAVCLGRSYVGTATDSAEAQARSRAVPAGWSRDHVSFTGNVWSSVNSCHRYRHSRSQIVTAENSEQ